jgi:pimeloyl-ACP methyl ester carboxylesterase
MPSSFQTRRFVGDKGIELIADVGGEPEAPPVLLLHGGGQTRNSWGATMKELVGRGYYVINLDARGHGDSQWASDGDYTFETQARDVLCVLDTFSSKPALVGASMGGATSLILAGAHQEPLVAALVLVDIVPSIHLPGADRISAFMNAHLDGFWTVRDAADAVAAYNPLRPRPKQTAALMKNLRRRENGRLYWHWDPRLISGSGCIEARFEVDRLKRAANHVRIPTLLTRGMLSDVVTDEGVADLLTRIPHMEVFEVGNAGHMVTGDRNDAFNHGVIDFLNRQFLLSK